MFLLKLSKLTLLISKNWIYYLIASYLPGKPTNNRTSQKIQLNLLKCIKEQNRSGTKLINETLQDQVNGTICLNY